MSENDVIQEILQRLIKIETLMEVKMSNVDARVKKIEDNLQWLWRTVIGGLIAGAIAIYFKK